MKRAYTKPKAKMVNFQYTERVVASGGIGNFGSVNQWDVCQMNSLTCGHYYNAGNYVCNNTPPQNNPGLPDPSI